MFIKKFQGYNLRVAKEFTLTFDGCRAKVGDIQLEITEEFLSEATGLPLTSQKWFKKFEIGRSTLESFRHLQKDRLL
jgi:hypothetical protein